SAFSAATDTASLTINAVNDAPVLDASKSPALTAVNEDAGAPVGAVGTLVSSLVDFASPAGQVDNVTDADGGALLGIAVTAADTVSLVVNAVADPPVAQAKSYSAQANMKIVGLTGLTAGATDPDDGIGGCVSNTFTVASTSATSPAGGTVTVTDASAGTFDFTPPPGVTGNVTFTYTVSDTGCPTSSTSAPATVTVSVAGPVIWFVNPTAASNGNGELSSPFQALPGLP